MWALTLLTGLIPVQTHSSTDPFVSVSEMIVLGNMRRLSCAGAHRWPHVEWATLKVKLEQLF